MTQEEVIEMARQSGLGFYLEPQWQLHEEVIAFANLVAKHERNKLQGQIETLYAMYELVSKQRDYLMDQQNAQVAAMRGSMQ
jgi:hypothetical protein